MRKRGIKCQNSTDAAESHANFHWMSFCHWTQSLGICWFLYSGTSGSGGVGCISHSTTPLKEASLCVLKSVLSFKPCSHSLSWSLTHTPTYAREIHVCDWVLDQTLSSSLKPSWRMSQSLKSSVYVVYGRVHMCVLRKCGLWSGDNRKTPFVCAACAALSTWAHWEAEQMWRSSWSWEPALGPRTCERTEQEVRARSGLSWAFHADHHTTLSGRCQPL